MLQQMTLPGFGACISSPESEAGQRPCGLPTGRNGCPSGPDRPPASHSAPQESALGATTPATSAPDLSIWSGPAAPRCCLENRSPARMLSDALQSRANAALERNLNGRGGTIYRYAWKQQVTPHGRELFLLRPSAHRISAKDCSSPQSIFDLPQAGWVTASARDWKDTAGMATTATNPDGTERTRLDQLPRQAQLAGWPTAMAGTPAQNGNNAAGNTDSSRKTVELAGWPTPDAQAMNVAADPVKHQQRRDRLAAKHGNGNGAGLPIGQAAHLAGWPTTRAADGEKNVRTLEGALSEICRKGSPQDLAQAAAITGPARLTASGDLLTGSCAGMSAGGQLNPAHSRWLMGYLAAWDSCGATAMQSCRRPQRSSSTRAAKS